MNIQLRFLSYAALAATMTFGLVACNGGGGTDNGEANGSSTENGSAEGLRGRPDPESYAGPIEGNEVRLGLVASLNGDLRPWGADCRRGAELAVKLRNEAGGIDGMTVRLLVEDSASAPEQGKNAAEKLINDGIHALLGEVSSGITQPMTQVSYENGIPHLAVGATKTTITDYGSNVFRVCYTDDFQGPVMAKFAYENLGLREMAIMTDEKQPYSQYLSQTFKEYFEQLGGTIVAEESYESKQTTFTSQISNLKAENPQGIFLSGYFTEVGPIVRQAGQAGLDNVKFLGGDGWDSTELLESGGDAIVGGFFCNHYNEFEDRQEVRDFLAAWEAEYGGRPGTTMGALGFDAANLMMDAIARAETKDAQGIINALENTVDFPGVSGNITLKGMGGNPAKQALVVEVTPQGFQARTAISYDEVFGS